MHVFTLYFINLLQFNTQIIFSSGETIKIASSVMVLSVVTDELEDVKIGDIIRRYSSS